MATAPLLQTLLRRERMPAAGALLLVVLLSWAWLLNGAGTMEEMDGMLMPMSVGPWSAAHAALMLAMWVVMMAAMMLPSAMPMILFYDSLARKRRAGGTGASVFALGYLAVWGVFSVVAVALQFTLERLAVLSPMMETTSIALAGVLLIGAGIYQWTPVKQACLRRCRSPLDFVLTHWRDGARGAFIMGVQHGAYCLGCCWMLMLLLFVGGVMNLAWIAGLTLFILLEKLMPAGRWTGRAAGLVLIGWGGGVLAGLY
jgi:predicted metal-binding membrane protein